MKNKTLSNQQGFSLIEALIAMVILSVGLLTLITMQTTGIQGNAKANSITEFSVFGADKIEQIFAQDYEDLDDTNGDGRAGLDAVGANADFTFPKSNPSDRHTIYANVAENLVMLNSKTIRVIVMNDNVGVNVAAPVKMDYMKLKIM